jgi:NAD(P)-dependent dehydrogenase (short-subunit alcohol dehydrogenase family)
VSGVAVVTGGSAGIGKAICERLLAEGREVVSLARRRCDIEHPRLHSIEVDLADRRATADAVRELAQRFELTTVIHNAGVIRPALLPDVQLADLDALVDLHLGCAAGDEGAPLRARRAAVLAGGARSADAHRLRRHQGRHAGHGPHLGAGARARGHHGQCGRARPDPHGHVL